MKVIIIFVLFRRVIFSCYINKKNRGDYVNQENRLNKGRRIPAYHYAVVFILGSIIGTWYEEILHLVNNGYFQSRHGVLYGPFNPLYGAGAVFFLACLYRFKEWYHVWTYGAILGGFFEYMASVLQQVFTGSVSWDYTDRITNIDGRTTVLYSIFWGFLALVLVKGLYPLMVKWLDRVPKNYGQLVTRVFMIFLTLNMLLSYTVLIRQGLRAKGYEPVTPIGQFYDWYYTDEKIQEKFPNMRLQCNVGDGCEVPVPESKKDR